MSLVPSYTVYTIDICDSGERTGYVGVTKNFRQRRAAHLRNAERGCDGNKHSALLYVAMNHALRSGRAPRFEVYAEGLTKSQAFATEQKITEEFGQFLLNSAQGGFGCRDPLPSTRALMSARARGKVCTQRQLDALREGRKIKRSAKPTAEAVARRAAALRGRHLSAEHKAKLSAAKRGQPSPLKGFKHSSVARENMAQAAKARGISVEVLNKMRAGRKYDAEMRRKVSVGQRAHWAKKQKCAQ